MLALGDLALNTGANFNKSYLVDTLKIMAAASQQSLVVVTEMENYDLFSYLQELRETIVDVYTTLIQAVADDQQSIQIIQQSAPSIIDYLKQLQSKLYSPHIVRLFYITL